jgi:hypothetical protein
VAATVAARFFRFSISFDILMITAYNSANSVCNSVLIFSDWTRPLQQILIRVNFTSMQPMYISSVNAGKTTEHVELRWPFKAGACARGQV